MVMDISIPSDIRIRETLLTFAGLVCRYHCKKCKTIEQNMGIVKRWSRSRDWLQDRNCLQNGRYWVKDSKGRCRLGEYLPAEKKRTWPKSRLTAGKKLVAEWQVYAVKDSKGRCRRIPTGRKEENLAEFEIDWRTEMFAEWQVWSQGQQRKM